MSVLNRDRTAGTRSAGNRPWLGARLGRWAVLLGLTGALDVGLSAEPWPGWRGNGDGVVGGGPALPTYWDAHRNRAWRVPLSRPGSGSPVVWEDRVLLVQPAERSTAMMCFRRRDGSIAWRVDLARIQNATIRSPVSTMQAPSRGGATPVTDGRRVVAVLGSVVWCLDLDGRELWRRDVENRDPSVGLPASPVLAGDLCLVALRETERIEALDLVTGLTRWSVPLERVARSLPLSEGSVFVADGGALRALRTVDGREAWRGAVDGVPSRFGPVGVTDGLLLPAPGRGVSLWEPPSAGPAASAGKAWSRRWENRSVGNVCSSAVASAERVFLLDDAGDVLCLDRRDGRELGRRRLRESMSVSGSWTAPILASGLLYVANESGDVVVLEADPGLGLKAVNRLGEGLSSSPAASDGSLFLRTDLALWCLREGANGAD